MIFIYVEVGEVGWGDCGVFFLFCGYYFVFEVVDVRKVVIVVEMIGIEIVVGLKFCFDGYV